MATIELRGITVAYGARPALDDLDLIVHGGTFLVLVGPSGCGTTTVPPSSPGSSSPPWDGS